MCVWRRMYYCIGLEAGIKEELGPSQPSQDRVLTSPAESLRSNSYTLRDRIYLYVARERGDLGWGHNCCWGPGLSDVGQGLSPTSRPNRGLSLED